MWRLLASASHLAGSPRSRWRDRVKPTSRSKWPSLRLSAPPPA